VKPHDLRLSFVTRKLADRVPAQLMSRYVGHGARSDPVHNRCSWVVSQPIAPVPTQQPLGPDPQ